MPKSSPKPLTRIENILVCNMAHRGDAIIMSYVVSALKKQFPLAKIGILVAPEAASFMAADKVHLVTHFKHCRSTSSLFQKIFFYLKSLPKLIAELKREKYDIAIDTYLYLGNSAWILYLAQIPWRIGFTSGGFGFLFTHRCLYEGDRGFILNYYPLLLEPLNIQDPLMQASLKRVIPQIVLPKTFIILHPGSADVNKMIHLKDWQQIIRDLSAHQGPIWITGQGKQEEFFALALKKDFPSLVMMINQLSLEELSYVMGKAACVISVDSMAVHLAAAVNTPCVQIFTSKQSNSLWEIKSSQGYICYFNETSSLRIRDYVQQRLEDHDAPIT